MSATWSIVEIDDCALAVLTRPRSQAVRRSSVRLGVPTGRHVSLRAESGPPDLAVDRVERVGARDPFMEVMAPSGTRG